MPAKDKPQVIDLNTLGVQDLAAIDEQLTEEVRSLAQSTLALQKIVGEFGSAGRACQMLADQAEGQPTLIPLTSSVYVPGELASSETVLIDIGTGYYVEKTPALGVDYCDRKVNYLKENLDAIGQKIKEKQRALADVKGILSERATQQQPAR